MFNIFITFQGIFISVIIHLSGLFTSLVTVISRIKGYFILDKDWRISLISKAWTSLLLRKDSAILLPNFWIVYKISQAKVSLILGEYSQISILSKAWPFAFWCNFFFQKKKLYFDSRCQNIFDFELFELQQSLKGLYSLQNLFLCFDR